MWRSLFLAFGVYACVLGLEAMAVQKAVFKPEVVGPGHLVKRSEVVPEDWTPWSLLGGGAVTVLYSFTLPRRVGSD